ncbi:hypothetical protein [Homoserinimonas sp. OAct 916]|uniref:hypothetical protein n=1 Tax=Homoserinimonas sp. OAct 916 TaxID=2211450 RepID=UPI000DBE81EF|nr:hypothetical protein [Homoserinimonas sp. OAct 916]
MTIEISADARGAGASAGVDAVNPAIVGESTAAAATAAGAEEILTPDAPAFLEQGQRHFHQQRSELLAARDAKREVVARTGRLYFPTIPAYEMLG